MSKESKNIKVGQGIGSHLRVGGVAKINRHNFLKTPNTNIELISPRNKYSRPEKIYSIPLNYTDH